MKLYQMVKPSLDEEVEMMEYEVIVETTVSFTFSRDDKLLTLSIAKIGTELFENPTDAKEHYIRQQQERVKMLEELIIDTRQGLIEAERYDIIE